MSNKKIKCIGNFQICSNIRIIAHQVIFSHFNFGSVFAGAMLSILICCPFPTGDSFFTDTYWHEEHMAGSAAQDVWFSSYQFLNANL